MSSTNKLNREFLFNNGDQVKDKVTGFSGVITGTAFYLTGCNNYLVCPKVKDEFSQPVTKWFDEGRLDLIEPEKVSVNDVKALENGADELPTSTYPEPKSH